MDEDQIKKDLKGRQKKIENLLYEKYCLECELKVAQDNYETEKRKNLRLYCQYIVAVKELAVYKAKEESDG